MQETLQEQIETFLSYLQKRGRSEHTLQTYRRGLEFFCQFFKLEDISALETPDIVAFKEVLTKYGASPRTINTRLATVRRFVNYLQKKHHVQFSQDLEFDLINLGEQFLDAVLTESDINRILNATRKFQDVRAEAIITTLAYTGVRVHELLKIPVSAASTKSLQVYGKGRQFRTVFISALVRKSWKKYLPTRIDNSEFLFTGKQGVLSRRRVHDILKFYGGQARIKLEKIHAHAFRHFCGRYLYNVEGYSMAEGMAVLGHRDPKTFIIYTRPTREEMEKKIQKSFQGVKKLSKKTTKSKKR